MGTWEYKWITFYKADSGNVEANDGDRKIKGYKACEAYLDKLGSERWELVDTAHSHNQYGQFLQIEFFFKRPRQ